MPLRSAVAAGLTVVLLGVGSSLIGVSAASAAVPIATQLTTAPSPIGDGLVEFSGSLYYIAEIDGDATLVRMNANRTFTVVTDVALADTDPLSFGGLLYFSADYLGDNVLYEYDGINPPTPVPGSPVDVLNLAPLDETMAFSAEGTGGLQVAWLYLPGTGFVEVPDSPNDPENFTYFDNHVVFSATDGTERLYSWDGTTDPPVEITGPALTGFELFHVFDGRLYFDGNNGANYFLYGTDGLTYTPVAGSPSDVYVSGVAFGVLLLSADGPDEQQIYEYDGINAPSLIPTSPLGSFNVTPLDPDVYLTSDGGVAIYNGSTFQVVPNSPTSAFGFTVLNGVVYFINSDNDSAPTLWALDQPALAATGIDGTPLFGIATLLLAAGALVMLRRRAVTPNMT